jgi:hypothetical protein
MAKENEGADAGVNDVVRGDIAELVVKLTL